MNVEPRHADEPELEESPFAIGGMDNGHEYGSWNDGPEARGAVCRGSAEEKEPGRLGKMVRTPAASGAITGVVALGGSVIFGALYTAIVAGGAYVAWRLPRSTARNGESWRRFMAPPTARGGPWRNPEKMEVVGAVRS